MLQFRRRESGIKRQSIVIAIAIGIALLRTVGIANIRGRLRPEENVSTAATASVSLHSGASRAQEADL